MLNRAIYALFVLAAGVFSRLRDQSARSVADELDRREV